MNMFALLRELAHARITVSLSGDKLVLDGNLRTIEALRPDLIEHKAELRALLSGGGYEAAMRDAIAPQTGTALRAHLLALADRYGINPAYIHRLHDLDVAACEGCTDAQLVTYLDMLDDTVTRQAGKVPPGHTAAIHCYHCGPVFVHPSIAACLPVVNDWPQALGCPWCLIRRAGGYIPRPKVQCSACAHFHADAINPPAGIGHCACGHGAYYPMQRHGCAAFERVGNPTPTEKGTHA
ncbi:hypothetical protein [Dyella silvae]|uniref:hypothetical protein n=1 Tax=Dyella silvae TaxID=2994424 RepID=UPI002263D8A2|nr:hypothetical protein [Dyella silvae]